ncbi:MAG: hypothetical protein INR72_14340 [Williamsia herbipolensis]|nr:hypothetical protein [Williamsia herbipolensis]
MPTVPAGSDGVAHVDSGVTVRLAGLVATTVKAETPGEVSGPAVVVRVEIANHGSAPASVDSPVVAVTASDGTWGIGTSAGGGQPLSGSLAPGATVTGSYVFMLADPRGRAVTVTVSHAAGTPVARFEGTIS